MGHIYRTNKPQDQDLNSCCSWEGSTGRSQQAWVGVGLGRPEGETHRGENHRKGLGLHKGPGEVSAPPCVWGLV